MSRFLNYPQAWEIFSLIKTYVDDHSPDDVVYSVSINGGDVIRPDVGGNVDLTLPIPDLTDYVKKTDTINIINLYGGEAETIQNLGRTSDPLATKSYVDTKIPELTNIIKTVSVNGGTRVGPDSSGNADLLIKTYTLELDGGSDANITASIDGGEPVSKDSDDNINLNVPDKYIDTISGWGRTFTNANNPMYTTEGEAIPHSLNLGFIGKPRYYVDITPSPAFISVQTPAFFIIKLGADAVIELFGLDNEYCKFGSRGVMAVSGDVYIGKIEYGHFNNCYLVGCAKSCTMDIRSLGSYQDIKLVTSINADGEPIFSSYNYNVWEKNVVVKGLDASAIKTYIFDKNSEVRWIYKPITHSQYISYDDNTKIPGMFWDIMGGFSSDSSDGYLYLNWHNAANFGAAHWKFYDCYEGGMVDESGVARDWTFRMPYYPNISFQEGADQYILLDFALINSAKSRIDKDFRCVIEDPAGNLLLDVKMKAFNAQTSALTIANDNRIHIYKRIKYNCYTKSFNIYDNAEF